MTTIKVQFWSTQSPPKNFTGTVIYLSGSIEYYREYLVNGLLHREDGPARMYTDEWPCSWPHGKTEQYWLNGELQRHDRGGKTLWKRRKDDKQR